MVAIRGSWVVNVVVLLALSCESRDQSPSKAAPASPAKVTAADRPGAPNARSAGPAAVAAPGRAIAAKPAPKVEAQVARTDKADPIESLFPKRHAVSDTLSDKMRRRIRFRLNDVAKVPIALHDIIPIPNPDGSLEVFALYEYSAYEQCVLGYATRTEGREHCLDAPAYYNDEGKPVRLNRDCKVFGAVYARFAAPNEGTAPETGGELTVSSIPLPKSECEILKIHHMFVDDVDGDGKQELYLDLATARELPPEFRGSGGPLHSKRYLYVLSAESALEIQLSLLLSEIITKNEPNPEPLILLFDLDHDGHLDVVQIAACWEGVYSREPCPMDVRTRTQYLYDQKLDQWIPQGSAASPEPKAEAGDVP